MSRGEIISQIRHEASAPPWQFLSPEMPDSGPGQPFLHLPTSIGLLSILAMTKFYQGKIFLIFLPVLLTYFSVLCTLYFSVLYTLERCSGTHSKSLANFRAEVWHYLVLLSLLNFIL